VREGSGGDAPRRIAKLQDEALGRRRRKRLSDAIEAFKAQHADNADETKRKQNRILTFLSDYCERGPVRYVDQIGVETLDGYPLWRNKQNWAWIKEIEILRQFFEFCREREWPERAVVHQCRGFRSRHRARVWHWWLRPVARTLQQQPRPEHLPQA
jgi:hypothetical protein